MGCCHCVCVCMSRGPCQASLANEKNPLGGASTGPVASDSMGSSSSGKGGGGFHVHIHSTPGQDRVSSGVSLAGLTVYLLCIMASYVGR